VRSVVSCRCKPDQLIHLGNEESSMHAYARLMSMHGWLTFKPGNACTDGVVTSLSSEQLLGLTRVVFTANVEDSKGMHTAHRRHIEELSGCTG